MQSWADFHRWLRFTRRFWRLPVFNPIIRRLSRVWLFFNWIKLLQLAILNLANATFLLSCLRNLFFFLYLRWNFQRRLVNLLVLFAVLFLTNLLFFFLRYDILYVSYIIEIIFRFFIVLTTPRVMICFCKSSFRRYNVDGSLFGYRGLIHYLDVGVIWGLVLVLAKADLILFPLRQLIVMFTLIRRNDKIGYILSMLMVWG